MFSEETVDAVIFSLGYWCCWLDIPCESLLEVSLLWSLQLSDSLSSKGISPFLDGGFGCKVAIERKQLNIVILPLQPDVSYILKVDTIGDKT